VFVEGVRPILARKIRYWRDRRFKSRLLPPPSTPAPLRQWRRRTVTVGSTDREIPLMPSALDPAQEDTAMQHNLDYGDEARVAPPKRDYVVREATIADLDRLESMTLEDFDVDVSRVSVPADRKLKAVELEQAAQDFLAALRT